MRHPMYVEYGPEQRLFEVVRVRGYPTKNGRRTRVLIDPENQCIEVSATVPKSEQREVIARALAGVSADGGAWTLVPVTGRVF